MTPEAQRLFERVLAGEVDPGAQEVVEMSVREPEFDERLESALRVTAALDGAARFRQDVLSEAQAGGTAPGEEAFAARARELLLTGAAGDDAAASPGPWVVRLRWVAAAALLVALPFVAARLGGDGGGLPHDTPLGGGYGELWASPDLARFRWERERPPGARFVVVVQDARGRELLRSRPLEESRWEPAPEERAEWGVIRWRVELVGSDLEPSPTGTSRWVDSSRSD